MNEINIIGVDLAKSVFQLYGVDETGTAVLRRQLRRSQMLAYSVEKLTTSPERR